MLVPTPLFLLRSRCYVLAPTLCLLHSLLRSRCSALVAKFSLLRSSCSSLGILATKLSLLRSLKGTSHMYQIISYLLVPGG
jgi:hypothetical protein